MGTAFIRVTKKWAPQSGHRFLRNPHKHWGKQAILTPKVCIRQKQPCFFIKAKGLPEDGASGKDERLICEGMKTLWIHRKLKFFAISRNLRFEVRANLPPARVCTYVRTCTRAPGPGRDQKRERE